MQSLYSLYSAYDYIKKGVFYCVPSYQNARLDNTTNESLRKLMFTVTRLTDMRTETEYKIETKTKELRKHMKTTKDKINGTTKLREIRRLRAEVEKLTGFINVIEAQQMRLDNAHMTKEVTRVMRESMEINKKLLNEKEVKNIEQLLENIDKNTENAADITKALDTINYPLGLDTQDLDEELEAFLAEDEHDDNMGPGNNPLIKPAPTEEEIIQHLDSIKVPDKQATPNIPRITANNKNGNNRAAVTTGGRIVPLDNDKP